MKVRELIEQLKSYDPENEVVMSRDAEGNGYSPLYQLDSCTYVPDTTYSGELWYAEVHEDDPPEQPDGAISAVALWPTN